MSGPEILGSSGGVDDFEPPNTPETRLAPSSLSLRHPASSLSTFRPQIRVRNHGSFASPLPASPPATRDTTDKTSFQLTFFQRNAVFLTTIFASAFAFEIAFDSASNKIWDSINQGRQWKDIRHQYIQKAEEEDEE
ncbi:hypothetical protein PISL3812_07791 [Talaromyces islandicus]|uniref:Complex III subunit 9 n=1 Tax=Talaromyces islandicus TaxID=28573 RepID=A0A0U1M759_TALIS|nr:hypothetical protein PISL3812_07791 [Talaromyces islandicus]